MNDLQGEPRPVTLAMMAGAFQTTQSRLEGIVLRHRIDPAFYVGRTRMYGQSQVQRIYTILQAGDATRRRA